MWARILANAIVLLLSCVAAGCSAADAATEQFLITVLRSSDPLEVDDLLGRQRFSADAGLHDLQRNYRTGYGKHRHGRWQVVVSEGQTAFVATGSMEPQLQIPWIELTRRGPVPQASLVAQARMQGIYVQARRLRDKVELQFCQFSDPAAPASLPGSPGADLCTVLRGKPGHWLDAGGNLILESIPAATRDYHVRHSDPRRSRLLLRVDVQD